MSTIVVGAGPAGLSAAGRLADAGEDVVVLEATDHVGGRTWTNRDRLHHDQPADLGGSLIDLGQDAILAICKRYGITLTRPFSTIPAGIDGELTGASVLRNRMILDGRLVEREEHDRLVIEIETALDRLPPDPVETLPGWARRAGLGAQATAAWYALAGMNPTGAPWGVHVSNVHPIKTGKTVWMLQDGSDMVSHSIAAGLDVRLDHPVRLITTRGATVTVETDRGTFAARDVIVASPIRPTLRIGFDPVLPPWKVEALLATPMSQAGKIVGQYSDGAALAARMGPGIVNDGPVPFVWHREVGPEDTLVLLGLVTADDGHGALWDEDAALAELDLLVAQVAGDGPRRIAGIVQNWVGEEFAGGVVSVLSADPVGLSAALGQSVGSRVHFAGEHTASVWWTSMDGAIRSGWRAADEVRRRRRRGPRQHVAAT